MIEIPIIGAFLEAVGTILEKRVLRSKYLNYKNYTVYEFLAIVGVMIPFIYFFWSVSANALKLWNVFMFGIVIVVALFANLFIFYSLKRQKVTEFEPLWLMQSLFIVLLAFILFKDERNWIIFGLALFASMVLVLTHVKKHHLVFDKYVIAALIGSFLFALELTLSKTLLNLYSPFTFYFLRCLFIFLAALIIFRPDFKKVGNGNKFIMVIIGAVWVLYRVIMYYGFEKLGVVFTTLLFILSPAFLFLMAIVFMGERPTWREIVSTIVIVICVVVGIIVKSS